MHYWHINRRDCKIMHNSIRVIMGHCMCDSATLSLQIRGFTILTTPLSSCRKKWWASPGSIPMSGSVCQGPQSYSIVPNNKHTYNREPGRNILAVLPSKFRNKLSENFMNKLLLTGCLLLRGKFFNNSSFLLYAV